MNFLKLTHTAGTEVYINPRLVRAVLPQGAKGTRLVFDPAHEINVKEDASLVVDALRQLAG
jgi:hypothetical protein